MSRFVRVGSVWLNLDRLLAIQRISNKVCVYLPGDEALWFEGNEGDRLWQYATLHAVDLDKAIDLTQKRPLV